MPTLLLWDLDETLVTTAGAGERAIVRSAREHFGVDPDLETIPYAGKTDRRIGLLIRERFGLPDDPAELEAYLEDFVSLVTEELPASDARPLPAVPETLRAAQASPNHHQGLLTGNLRASAQAKLSPFGLWEYFRFGAFADDALERLDLGPVALARAAEHVGRDFSPEEVVVIGDTPHDIACAHALGARSLALATGRFSLAHLAAHDPSHLAADLGAPSARAFLGL